MTRFIRQTFASLCILSAIPASSFALDLYVDASRTGSGTQDGLSWGTAYADLQDALAVATTAGTDIHIAEGVYYPDENEAGVASGISNNDPTEYFTIPTNVSLYGGYETGGSEWRDNATYVTVLSGDIDQDDTTHEDGYISSNPLTNINGTNSYTVVSMVDCSSTTIVESVLITGGAAGDGDGTISVSRPDSGGGLYLDGGSPQFNYVEFIGNSSLEWGGGGIITGDCSATFTNCYFSNNEVTTTAGLESASGSGGALFIDETDLTTGVSFYECFISRNTAESNQGGGLRIAGNCVVSLDRCFVAGNSAVDGGGIYAFGVDQLQVTNSIIGGNYSSDDGAGAFINGATTEAVDFINCTFSGNRASSEGGALYIDGTSDATMTNSIVWNNSAGTGSSDSIGYDGVAMTINYSLVEGESVADLGGTGNLDGSNAGNDPLFYAETNPANAPTITNVYFLYASAASSPIVGAGNDSAISGYSSDIDNNDRIMGGAVDLGAYESSYSAQPELTGTMIDDVELAADPGAIDLVDITTIFGGTVESYAFSFSVEHVALLSFDGDTVRISAIGEAGESTDVTITAVGPGGDEVSDTFTVTLIAGANESSDALLSSWFTVNSGKYARIYEDASAESSDTTVTTWTITHGSGATTTQANPVYSDIQGIRYDNDFVYIEASGLGSHTMGPWAAVNGGTFAAYPVNQSYLRIFPRNPVVQSGVKDVASDAGTGTGLLVNGVATWGAVDSSSWNGTELERGDNFSAATYFWHQCAPPAEAFNFDSGNGHQPPSGIYHVHQNPIALRYQLGDNVTYDSGTKGYSEVLDSDAAFNGQHSPIIGWAHDGFPIYGPYGYDDKDTLGGSVRRMVPGFVKRDGTTSGVDDVMSNLSTLPAWYARFRNDQLGETYSLTASVSRATDTSDYPVGQFAQDWEHLSDASVSYVEGTDYDLDQYGGRICKTPEYPDGIYAYFLPIDETGESVYPYIMGFEFYGDATGGSTNNSNGSTVHYIGGPNANLDLQTPSVDDGDITLVWSSVEGGTYEVLSSNTESNFVSETSGIVGTGSDLSETFVDEDNEGYAQVTRTALATYDEVLSSVPSSTQTDTEAYAIEKVVWYVDAGRSGQGSQDGTSWSTAFASLQDALMSAVSGEEIWIAAGIYYPDESEAGTAYVMDNNTNARFALIEGVSVYGGFAGTETARSERDWDANVTILSGDIDQNDVTVNGVVTSDPLSSIQGSNALRVVSGTNTLLGHLDGVTITSGDGGFAPIVGGGTFRRCVIQGNYGTEAGALYQEGEVFTMIECDILANVGEDVGGVSAYGQEDYEMVSCRIQGNEAVNISGSISVGGIHLGNADANLVNCLITGNRGRLNGGVVMRVSGDLRIYNSTIASNYNSEALDIYEEAGGLGFADDANVSLYNTLIWENESAGAYNNVNGSLDTEYCLIEGVILGESAGLDGTDEGNDPRFIDEASPYSAPTTAGDYRVSGESLVVGAGDAIENPSDWGDLDGDGITGEILPLDLAGNDREIEETDIGAYEYVGPTVVSEISSDLTIEEGDAGDAQFVLSLDGIFGRSDLTYSLVSIAPSGVLYHEYAGESDLYLSPANGSSVDQMAVVEILATDSDGNQISIEFTVTIVAVAGPIDSLSASLSSWYTDGSARYARLYEDLDSQNAGTSVTTWSHGAGVQELPVYAGPQEVSYSDDWVYIQTPNLATYVMGPWYSNAEKTILFGTYPANQNLIHRFPRIIEEAPSKTLTTGGAIGCYVDGTHFYNNEDGFSYDTSEGEDQSPVSMGPISGDDVWRRVASVTEINTVDPSGAHQAGSDYHHHSSPKGLRYLLGDSMAWDEVNYAYSESFNGSHSPIIGWANDGLPMYGPYGYSDAEDAGSGVRRMVSGYQLRDGSNGSTNLNSTGRQSLPQWVNTLEGRSTTLPSGEYGPDTTDIVGIEAYSLGRYIEDYAYKGDLGLTLGVDFDLNLYNVRYCVTPEFPEGTWAYFNAVDELGDGAFPYNVGPAYFGDPTGDLVTSISETVTVTFTGGEATVETDESITIDSNAEEITIVWNVVEGGSYTVQTTNDLTADWDDSLIGEVAVGDTLEVTDIDSLLDESAQFYRITRTDIADYDSGESVGGATDGIDTASPSSASEDTSVTLTFSFASSAGQPASNASAPVASVTLGGITGTSVSRDADTGDVTATFDLTGLAVGDYDIVATFSPPDADDVLFTGTDIFSVTSGAGGGGGSEATFVANFAGPSLPPQGAYSSVTVGGVEATSFTRDSDTQVTIIFDPSSLSGGGHIAVLSFTPPNGSLMTRDSSNTYTAE
ncbi:MAG: YHYH protein [Opitutaceae bacterium]